MEPVSDELHLNRFGPPGPAQILMIHGLTGHGRRWHNLAAVPYTHLTLPTNLRVTNSVGPDFHKKNQKSTEQR